MIRKSLMALAALTLAGAAHASLYTFTGSIDTDPMTEVVTGSFSFDDAEAAAGNFDGSFSLTSLDFTFHGETFTLADALNSTDLNYTYVLFEGGSLTGPNASFTTSEGTFSFQGFFGVSAFTFAPTRGDEQLGTLTLTQSTVPEPASLALVMGSLAAVGVASRRRKAA